MKQSIQLSDHFGYGRLLRFTIPSILMMIFSAPDCHVPGSGGRDAGGLRPVWPDHSGGAAVFDAAVCVLQSVRDGREAETWTDRDDRIGNSQYDRGRAVYGCVLLGHCRRSHGIRYGTDCRRNCAAHLLLQKEQQQSADPQAKMGWQSASSCLHQRRVRAYEQHFHVHCRHAEQPADGTAFPPVPGWWPSLWQIG